MTCLRWTKYIFLCTLFFIDVAELENSKNNFGDIQESVKELKRLGGSETNYLTRQLEQAAIDIIHVLDSSEQQQQPVKSLSKVVRRAFDQGLVKIKHYLKHQAFVKTHLQGMCDIERFSL
jgi:hypothetical protein